MSYFVSVRDIVQRCVCVFFVLFRESEREGFCVPFNKGSFYWKMSILWGESAVTNMSLWVWNKSFLSLWVEPVEGMLICRWGANCHGSEKLVARALARDRFLAVRIHCGLLFAKREFHVKNIVFPGICSILVIHYLNGTSQFVLQSKSHYRKFLQNCGLYWGLWVSK